MTNKMTHFFKHFFTGSVSQKEEKFFKIFVDLFLCAAATYLIGEVIGSWMYHIMH